MDVLFILLFLGFLYFMGYMLGLFDDLIERNRQVKEYEERLRKGDD